MIHHFTELNSTNQYALDNHTKLLHGDVIIADSQTEGRGRNRNMWLSLNGNLFMTLLLKLQGVESEVFMTIPQYTGVIILRVFKKLGVEPQLKWPNDVLVGNKKIAGILVESNVDRIAAVGIGINIDLNNKQLLGIGKPAISLKQLGIKLDKNSLAELIIKEFYLGLDSYLLGGFSSIYNEYKEGSAFMGKKITVKYPHKQLQGVFNKINQDGSILLITKNSEEIRIFSGELSLSYENK